MKLTARRASGKGHTTCHILLGAPVTLQAVWLLVSFCKVDVAHVTQAGSHSGTPHSRLSTNFLHRSTDHQSTMGPSR